MAAFGLSDDVPFRIEIIQPSLDHAISHVLPFIPPP
jgi:hypothetical protein